MHFCQPPPRFSHFLGGRGRGEKHRDCKRAAPVVTRHCREQGSMDLVLGTIFANPPDVGQRFQFFETRPAQPRHKGVLRNVAQQFHLSGAQFRPPDWVKPFAQLNEEQPGKPARMALTAGTRRVPRPRSRDDALVAQTNRFVLRLRGNSHAEQRHKENPGRS